VLAQGRPDDQFASTPLAFSDDQMRIFLSSTFQDLNLHRERAAQAIERLGQHGIRMEVFGARPTEPTTACFDEIDQSDALVGIYAHRYGFVPAGAELSITEQEFNYARDNGKPIFCFIADSDHPWPPRHVETGPATTKLEAMKTRIRELVVADSFTSPEDLAYKVATSLGRFLLTTKVKKELDQIPRSDRVSTEAGRRQVSRRAAKLRELLSGARILLVNDVPSDMAHVVRILRGLTVEVIVATTSEAALQNLIAGPFDVVISDMQRGVVEDDGIRLLSEMRSRHLAHPVIFTVGRFDPSRGTPPYAFGITNRVDELLNLVFDALERLKG
jgi:CheY-like chemotaxis protein